MVTYRVSDTPFGHPIVDDQCRLKSVGSVNWAGESIEGSAERHVAQHGQRGCDLNPGNGPDRFVLSKGDTAIDAGKMVGLH